MSTTTTTAATNSEIIDSTFVNSILEATELAGFSVMVEAGECEGEVGWVKHGGLARATGTISIANAFTNPIEDGINYSLYGRLPPKRNGTVPGLLELLNQSLELLDVEDTIFLAGVTSQKHYAINTSTYPWFTDDTKIIEIQYPLASADDIPMSMERSAWEWVADGETLKLRFRDAPFRTGEQFGIKVYRPGNSKIRRSGVWIDQTAQGGTLVNLYDEALPSIIYVRPMMLARCYDALAAMAAPGQTVAEWSAKGAIWKRVAAKQKRTSTPRDPLSGIPQLRPAYTVTRGIW